MIFVAAVIFLNEQTFLCLHLISVCFLFTGLLKGKDNVVDKDLNDMAKKETVADKMFHKFKKRIQFEPEQVLRYQHKGT